MLSNASNIKTKHFQKWAENKNPFFSPIFLFIASSSKEMHTLINLVSKGKRIEGDVPLPKLKTWLKLYNNQKRINIASLKLMAEQDKDSAREVKILQSINDSAIKIKNNPAKFISAFENIKPEEKQILFEQSMMMFGELKELIINDLLGEISEAKRNKFMNSIKHPELIFFFHVQAPCFMLYGTYPHMLLKKAQSGDDDALEKLIRLDKSIIFEPKISEIIHQAQALKAQERIIRIQKAFTGKPKATMSIKKVKILLGGLISYFSIKFNQKLSAAEIRNLFDAIALDRNDDIDQDLGDMVGEPFEKAIQRSRSFWDIILADKK